MSETEKQIVNIITGASWAEGAATPERLGSFLNRRMAAVALAEADLEAAAEADYTETLAA